MKAALSAGMAIILIIVMLGCSQDPTELTRGPLVPASTETIEIWGVSTAGQGGFVTEPTCMELDGWRWIYFDNGDPPAPPKFEWYTTEGLTCQGGGEIPVGGQVDTWLVFNGDFEFLRSIPADYSEQAKVIGVPSGGYVHMTAAEFSWQGCDFSRWVLDDVFYSYSATIDHDYGDPGERYTAYFICPESGGGF